ncbi:MAG TPA: LD-carboxypeptidase [Verrucomicrobiae bacterium]|jgi:muramoyltetrapeptide carboxypeptidase|nr:LD-carboxypeptidase [Verrucomicrobiae bacterium]
MTTRSGVPMTRESTSQSERSKARKPRALTPHSMVMPFAPASPAEPSRIAAGIAELTRLGWQVATRASTQNDGYFAGTMTSRHNELLRALEREDIDALIGTRGGYGSNYLLDDLHISTSEKPKIILGFSDLTSLQIYLWQRFQWVTFYGPMLAAGLDAGPGAPKGYDEKSLLGALQNTIGGWSLDLQGEQLTPGEANGRVLGGCLTLVETAIGTQWDLQTDDAILVLEDRGMKPWQVDRALMHLQQAGKFTNVCGIVLGDFPECEAPVAGSPTVIDVCQRILSPLGVPIVFGAPIGHTTRPMLTVPVGVKARLSTKGAGVLEILEPAVVA